MSLSNGYTFEMPDISTSNSDFEAILRGQEASGSDSAIAELVSHIRSEAGRLESPANSDTHIAAAAAAVPEMTTPTPSAARPKVRPRRLRRRMVVLASVMGLLLATAGVGLAADHAVPGETLYGLDIALEKIGIGNGKGNGLNKSERLAEVVALFEAGQVGLALGHAATTVATIPEHAEGMTAQEALEAAADRLETNGNAPSGVAALLDELVALIGTGDGAAISLKAQEIRNIVEEGSPPIDPPVGPPVVPPVVPPGPPSSTPGQSNVPGSG